MAMDVHDRGAALAAFEAALAISPSSALTCILGAGSLAWAGQAERIEWVEQGLRLSPLDPFKFIAYRGLAKAHFLRGHYHEAAEAARKAVQFNPGFGSSYMLLAAPLMKLGRHEEAKSCVARLLEREPAFRLSRQFAGVDCAPALAAALSEALRDTGVPECSNSLNLDTDRLTAFGTKRTLLPCSVMSAFGGKADMIQSCSDVRF